MVEGWEDRVHSLELKIDITSSKVYACLNNFARPSSRWYNISHSAEFPASRLPLMKSYHVPPLVALMTPVTSFAFPVCSGRELIIEYARCINDVRRTE